MKQSDCLVKICAGRLVKTFPADIKASLSELAEETDVI